MPYQQVEIIYLENTSTRNAFYAVEIEKSTGLNLRWRLRIRWGKRGCKGQEKVQPHTCYTITQAKRIAKELADKKIAKGYRKKTPPESYFHPSSSRGKTPPKKKPPLSRFEKRFAQLVNE
jgi:predicted DNA-binding WGR domain protein